MIQFLLWYIVISLLGWISFPIAYRFLPGLTDRGYTASRTLGLLLWSYLFWVLASLGILPFTTGGLFVSLALIIGFTWWILQKVNRVEFFLWLRTHKRVIIFSELLFFIAFAGYALLRAANPDAVGTEKPMELAFINAILHSQSFPPHDPWLSGYAISYYYFGYVMTAMLAKITGISGGVAFNLGIAMIFALSASGAFGLIFNLLNACFKNGIEDSPRKAPGFFFASLIGPLYVLIVSNLEGLLEILHARGIFWRWGTSGQLISSFWHWLDLQDLIVPPQQPFSWTPARFWWWWRASRVLQDYDLAMNSKEIIDEFPFFSFLLADLHPHVLAMPFAFLAIALALNVLIFIPKEIPSPLEIRIPQFILTGLTFFAFVLGVFAIVNGSLQLQFSKAALGLILLTLGAIGLIRLITRNPDRTFHSLILDKSENLFRFPTAFDPVNLFLTAVALGGMAFLNTWDFPLYVFIFATSFAMSGIISHHHSITQAIKHFVVVGIALGICGGILYLPFYLGFSSQAGGILPNLIYPTRGTHFWIMFAPLLLPLVVYLIYLQVKSKDPSSLIRGAGITAGLFVGFAFLALLLALVILLIPRANQAYFASLAGNTPAEAFTAAITRRWLWPGTWLTLFLMLSLGFSQILQAIRKSTQFPRYIGEKDEEPPETHVRQNGGNNIPSLFSIILILAGLFLTLVPEFVYLYDFFGWRINTIFKFYFQAWLIWSIAASFSAIILLIQLKGAAGLLFRLTLILIFFASLVYPALGVWDKTNGFVPGSLTLDATAYYRNLFPDETSAIDWLHEAPYGVVAEAVPSGGGSYTEYARVSTFSGLPSVLGWIGHENQWRGGNQPIGSRQNDLSQLYCSDNWEEVRTILERYQIRYIFWGRLEQQTYMAGTAACRHGVSSGKFDRYLQPVFQAGQTRIYEYSNAANLETQIN